MYASAKYKVPDGKLLEVKLYYDDVIKEVQILGDFFVYPEESLKDIENLLVGTKIQEREEEMAEKVRKFIRTRHVELIGMTPEAIARAITIAVR